MRRVAPLLSAFALFAPLALVVFPSCAFNWDVQSGTSVDAATDAKKDSAIADANSFDATSADVTTTDATTEDAPSTDTDSGPDCAALKANVVSAEANAIACTQVPGACASKVNDECNCGIYVGTANSDFANTYVAAVSAYVNSGCALNCSAGCPTITSVGTCILGPAGYNCYSP